MHNARRSVCMSAFVFLCVGLTSTAFTFDSPPPHFDSPPPPPFAQDPGTEPEPASAASSEMPSEISWMVEHWPARCAKLEASGEISEASRCWWMAAEEIRYATDTRVPADEVKRLRTQWLWRGARLSLQAPRPAEPAHPSAEPLPPGTTATPAAATTKKLASARSPKVKSPGLATSCGNETVFRPAAASVKVAALPQSAPMKKQNVTSRYRRQAGLLSDRRREKTRRACSAHWWTRHAASAGCKDAPGRTCCGPLCLRVLSAGASLVMEMIGAIVPVQGCR